MDAVVNCVGLKFLWQYSAKSGLNQIGMSQVLWGGENCHLRQLSLYTEKSAA
jgi:hypothetical protein